MRARHKRLNPRPFLLLLLLPALLAADRPRGGAPAPAATPSIELHVGIRDLVYIGQPLTDLVRKFPGAEVMPFSGQEDAASVKIAEAGISCIAVGAPGDLRVASIGFNISGVEGGVAETKYRTSKGIGKGSTVNDLLEAYGPPLEVLGESPRGALRRSIPLDSPAVPKMYQYGREDGAVKSFFLVENHEVMRLVVNELAPLDEHIVKGHPKK